MILYILLSVLGYTAVGVFVYWVSLVDYAVNNRRTDDYVLEALAIAWPITVPLLVVIFGTVLIFDGLKNIIPLLDRLSLRLVRRTVDRDPDCGTLYASWTSKGKKQRLVVDTEDSGQRGMAVPADCRTAREAIDWATRKGLLGECTAGANGTDAGEPQLPFGPHGFPTH